MAQRLSAPERRAQIIAATRSMIAEEGPRSVGLRAVARRLGMTAPGITHHFPTVTDLYRAVIDQYNADQDEIVTQIATAGGAEITLLGLADALAMYYAEFSEESRNFDRLEAAAMAPDHPAHGLYPATSVQPLPVTVYLAERDYQDPADVVKFLGLVADGLRFRWLQERDAADIWADWLSVRGLFVQFPKKADAVPDPPIPETPKSART